MENKDVVVIEKDTKDITAQANEIVIMNQEQYEGANVFLRADKMLQKRIHEAFDTIVDSAYRTWKEAGNKRKVYLEPVVEAEKVVKGKMIAYSEKMDAQRREKQRKLEEQARREEEKKKKDLADRAEKWAAKGNDAKAEELQEQAEDTHVEAIVVASKVEKVAGLSCRDKYSVDEITDAEKVPREYLEINISALNKIAQATKGSIKIPGVKFKCEKVLASRM